MQLHISSVAIAAGLVAVAFQNQFPIVRGHSWLECTDYRMSCGAANSREWDPSVCFGRARCGQRQAQEGFGVDTGFNFHSKSGCQCARGSASYDSAPMAVYRPGQRVCLAYPSKNHVAAECTNAFIPDAGVTIRRSPLNPSSDHEFVREYQHQNGEHTDGQIDYKGYQNCPNFCDNMDKSLCTMCFQLENDIAPGEYTFQWLWAFNSPDDVYSSCWEARVEAGEGPAPVPAPAPEPAPGPAPVPSMHPTPAPEPHDSDECENGPNVPVSYNSSAYDQNGNYQNGGVQPYPDNY